MLPDNLYLLNLESLMPLKDGNFPKQKGPLKQKQFDSKNDINLNCFESISIQKGIPQIIKSWCIFE